MEGDAYMMYQYTNLEVLYPLPVQQAAARKGRQTGNCVVLKTGGQEPMTQEEAARLRREYQSHAADRQPPMW